MYTTGQIVGTNGEKFETKINKFYIITFSPGVFGYYITHLMEL